LHYQLYILRLHHAAHRAPASGPADFVPVALIGHIAPLDVVLRCQRVYTQDVTSFAEAVQMAVKKAEETGLAEKGQRLVMTAGVPFGTPGSTNILRVAWVE